MAPSIIFNMSNRLKPKSKAKEPLDPTVGAVSEDIEVPVASEVIFKKIWHIRKFHRTIKKRELVDSPVFRCSVNGMATFWSVSIRFWKGPNGKKVTNPIVVCLNLTGCETEETGQARVRFQFGVWDASIKHWECCPISNVIVNLQNTQELLSVGYKSLGILERHIDNSKDVSLMVKIQIVKTEEERHSLSQDLARIFTDESEDFCDTIVETFKGDEDETGIIKAHSFLIRARSTYLGQKLVEYSEPKNLQVKFKLDLSQISHGLVKEVFRYIYTDKVDTVDDVANKILPLSVKYGLQGLTALCERNLLESLTPSNVANILLLADQCGCESLRKAALHYCEESEEIKDNVYIGKTLAWRVMEMVNPDLFLEACESIGSSSSALDSPSTPGSYSD